MYDMPGTMLGRGIMKICQIPSLEEYIPCEKERPTKNKWQNVSVRGTLRDLCKGHIRGTVSHSV